MAPTLSSYSDALPSLAKLILRHVIRHVLQPIGSRAFTETCRLVVFSLFLMHGVDIPTGVSESQSQARPRLEDG